jgi:hypothetical protein
MPASAGWVEGDAAFVGENPPSGAAVTYYQRSRHIFGPLKLEVLDEGGKVIDTLAASKRRGINRVNWSMQVKPPRVPRAAQVAFNASQGPRLVPGTYTVRLTSGSDVVETKLKIGLDRRAPYGVADRKAQFDAVMRARALFGDMSGLVDRLDTAHGGALARARALPAGDALAGKLGVLAGKLEAMKRKIVATKEGGAITGEERIREHLDLLYGALMGWEGRPARYQLDRIEALRHELGDVNHELDDFVAHELPPVDAELRRRKLESIPTSAKTASAEPGGGAVAPTLALRCLRTRGADCPSGEVAGHAAGERD